MTVVGLKNRALGLARERPRRAWASHSHSPSPAREGALGAGRPGRELQKERWPPQRFDALHSACALRLCCLALRSSGEAALAPTRRSGSLMPW